MVNAHLFVCTGSYKMCIAVVIVSISINSFVFYCSVFLPYFLSTQPPGTILCVDWLLTAVWLCIE
jgi:hypothetical protein